MTFNTIISGDLNQAVQFLKQGDIIGIPTETVYGLAANALNADAVVKIFEAKNRPFLDPLIVHIHNAGQVSKYVSEFNDKAKLLADKFWPGPLTLLLPKNNLIPDLVTSGLDRVALRVPNHKLTLELLSRLEFPLAAPSANPFGYISPTAPYHVLAQLNGRLPMILDGGLCSIGLESTIVGFEDNDPVIYRLGGITKEAIEAVVGVIKIAEQKPATIQNPGMLETHYSPRKPLIFGNMSENINKFHRSEIGLICFKEPRHDLLPEQQMVLSPTGNLNEAAKNLFAAMRTLDASSMKVIIAEEFPEHGLGLAINDRLRRASFNN